MNASEAGGVKETIKEEDEETISSFPFRALSSVISRKMKRPSSIMKYRDAMGEYIPPAGFKPLTYLALPTPGPSDYNPQTEFVYPSSPKYSLRDRITPKRLKFITPGPKYNLRDVELDCKWPLQKNFYEFALENLETQSQKPTKRLPVSYLKTYSSLKKNSAILLSRPKAGVHIGTKPEQIMQIDTIDRLHHPAPNKYVLQPPKRKEAKRTLQPKLEIKKKSKLPGPAHYSVPAPIPEGPQFTLKARLDDSWRMKSRMTPSPAAYTIPTTIGLSPAYSLKGSHAKSHAAFRQPGPSDYVYQPKSRGHVYSFSYRPLPRKDPWTTPGSNAYDPKTPKKVPFGPTFGTRKELLIDFQKYAVVKHLDLPISYSELTDYKDSCKNRIKIKSRIPEKARDTLAPNIYYPDHNIGKPSSQKFSFGRKIVRKGENKSYTNALYYPMSPKGIAVSIQTGFKKVEKETVAPNKYYFPNVTRTGIKCQQGPSLKSRQSRYVYSGICPRIPIKAATTTA